MSTTQERNFGQPGLVICLFVVKNVKQVVLFVTALGVLLPRVEASSVTCGWRLCSTRWRGRTRRGVVAPHVQCSRTAKYLVDIMSACVCVRCECVCMLTLLNKVEKLTIARFRRLRTLMHARSDMCYIWWASTVHLYIQALQPHITGMCCLTIQARSALHRLAACPGSCTAQCL